MEDKKKQKKIYSKFFEQDYYEEQKDVEQDTPGESSSSDTNPIVFLDIAIGDAEPERLEIELFASKVPKTAKNFLQLCTGEAGMAKCGKPLHYKNTIFHRNIKDFMIQGGDFQNANGTGGESIYGQKFADENFSCEHLGKGYLSMANSGANTNGSQFFITYKKTSWLDSKHVVFGKVIKNIEFLTTLEGMENGPGDAPKLTTKIVACGVLKPGEEKAAEGKEIQTQAESTEGDKGDLAVDKEKREEA